MAGGDERNGGKHGGGGQARWRGERLEDTASVGPGTPHPDTSFKGGALCHHLGQLPSGGVADVSPPQGGRERGQAEEGVRWLYFLLIHRYDFSVMCILGTK